MTQPKIIEASQAQLDELVALAVAASFPQPQLELLKHTLKTFVVMTLALQNVRTSVKKLRHMLFGSGTERLPKKASPSASAKAQEPGAGSGAPVTPLEDGPCEKDKQKGHGRRGADAYKGAPVVKCAHPTLREGDPCPQCRDGKLYLSQARTFVKVVGQVPLGATIYERDNWRCRLCEALYPAPLPAGVEEIKYDESAASMIAMLRYGSGMPFNRLEALQSCLQTPLSDATQWDIVQKAAAGPRHAFGELVHQAAQGEVLHHDDTPARILDLMGERRAKAERAANEAGAEIVQGRAINTTGIVSLVGERKVILFFTGHAHAGTNLAQVLMLRARELGKPIQMCDALAANTMGDLATILCHCVAHGRRKFFDVLESFPQACHHVIETLAQVYRHDAHCKQVKMSPGQRLAYHQAMSDRPMRLLKVWMRRQMRNRLVEPNSGLGKAIGYMQKHWQCLTMFLHQAGAPLDNNIVEIALKKAIIHRKNSMFYRSRRGAEVGDIYMSLIFSCQSCGANPLMYLNALQKHAGAVEDKPHLWLPWNFQDAMAVAA